ncbi:MAG: hypothetical protein AB7R89_06165 [Dehalococcoidia bacterium]
MAETQTDGRLSMHGDLRVTVLRGGKPVPTLRERIRRIIGRGDDEPATTWEQYQADAQRRRQDG